MQQPTATVQPLPSIDTKPNVSERPGTSNKGSVQMESLMERKVFNTDVDNILFWYSGSVW